VLTRQLDRALDHYRAHPEDASRWLAAGHPSHTAPSANTDPAETAAYMLVASLILNLDEAITHE
jgi:hypothetical protein